MNNPRKVSAPRFKGKLKREIADEAFEKLNPYTCSKIHEILGQTGWAKYGFEFICPVKSPVS